MAALGEGEEGRKEKQNLSPLSRTKPHKGGGETSLRRWKKSNKTEVFSLKREESFSGRSG
jgi:hypothetical protein